jgi:hypothetical protein
MEDDPDTSAPVGGQPGKVLIHLVTGLPQQHPLHGLMEQRQRNEPTQGREGHVKGKRVARAMLFPFLRLPV